MAIAVLRIPNISCEHCQRTIINALTPLAGVRDVRVDIPTQRVRVDYDETRLDVERMKAILEEEDYPVTSLG
jgi:copper chaperone